MLAQNIHFSAPPTAMAVGQARRRKGGYLEPSLSMLRLTRMSAALTCSLTAFTQ